MERRERIILMLFALGMLAAAYGLHLHFSATGSRLCDINDTFNCDSVNKSEWSELFGIPVALLGLLGYAFLFFVVLLQRRVRAWLDFTDRDVWGYVLGAVLFMLCFQAYLTAIEIFRIGAYCLVCLVNQATLLAIAWLVSRRYMAAR
jgi:uncharacterized membrane protein